VKRPLFVFGLMLVGPAVVLAALGWRSLAHEDQDRRSQAREEARRAADDAIHAEANRLETTREQEGRRPYFEYQARFMPQDVLTSGAAAFVESPLEGPPQPGGPSLWFQWSLSNGVVSGPDVFPSGRTGSAGSWLTSVYGELLRTRLLAAPAAPELRTAPPQEVALRVVAANEEVGQLLEEVQVASNAQKETPYLENFANRTQGRGAPAPAEPTVAVRSTPFRYLSLPSANDRLPLVAWRLVWIPGLASKDRRDAPVDRYLLQGYGYLEPIAAQAVQSIGPSGPLMARGALTPSVPSGAGPGAGRGFQPGYLPRSLFEVLPVETPGGPLTAERAPLEMVVAAASNVQALQVESRGERLRYLLLTGGLLSVVCVGFFVLWRSVRREMALVERKQDFVAAITHELKTPLAGIRMYADMLKEGWVPEGATPGEYADRIVGETKRLGSLVDQVLDFAAYERGVSAFSPLPGDLGEAVRSAVALTAPASTDAAVPVAVEIEPGLPPVLFDPNLVRPLVLNLVDNAIKYSARGPTKDVRVSVKRDKGGVALVVADRGPGIAEADQARLFQPFSRGGREETRTARGVGLGLALVRRYAQAHGAQVSLDSELGRGTTVTVRFPGR